MYRDLLSAYIDGELNDGDRESLELRLKSDADLREELQRYQRIRTFLHDEPIVDVDACKQKCWQSLMARAEPRPRFWQRRLSVPMPFAAAAAITVFALSAVLSVNMFSSAPRQFAPMAVEADMDMSFQVVERSREASLQQMFLELQSRSADEPMTIALPAGHSFDLNGDPQVLRGSDLRWGGRR